MGLFEEYCGSSTVHGVRYFTDKKRHWMERLWWMVAFALALFYCGKLIQNVYIKWNQSPVIVSFAEKSTPVWEIPFPAVTICPETKSQMSHLNFTDVFLKMLSKHFFTARDEELVAVVFQLCDAELIKYLNVGLIKYSFVGQNFTNSSITDLLRNIAPNLTDTLVDECAFRNIREPTHKMFQEIMTDEGLCFTFNTMNGSELYTEHLSPDYPQINHKMSAKHWKLDGGYNSSIKTDGQIYPYRVFGSGSRDGLQTMLRLYKKDVDHVCRGAIEGFRILLHTPGEIPQLSKHYIKVPSLHEVLVSVKPNVITTSEGLRDYEPKVACGCVKFSMPREKETPICGVAKVRCYNEAQSNFLKEQFEEALTLEPGAERVKGCNCLPACTSITYDAEISQGKFDLNLFVYALFENKDTIPSDVKVNISEESLLSIFFKENEFITSKRSELYGQTDFLANCGGLLGLFMGASFLSIVELLYFLSLRLCCNLRSSIYRKLRNKIAGSAVPEVGSVQHNDNATK